MRIAIDQDQVLADLLTPWLQKYNEVAGDNLNSEDIKSWDVSKYVKDGYEKIIFELLDDYNLFRNLPIIEGSQEIVRELSSKYEVFIQY